jgi:hypothetical protein
MPLPALLRRSITVWVLGVALLASLVVVAPTPAEAAVDARAEADFVALVNIERAKRGLHALAIRSDLISVSRTHSVRMANQNHLHHNPNLATDVKNWQRLAENVGRGPSVTSLHTALMNSEGHRRNILDDRVTEIGVGVEVRGSTVWVTQVFRRPSSGVTILAPTTTRFGDVSSTHPEATAILSVASRGITEGCTDARFCPASTLTRAQAASLLVRALDLPATSRTGTFRDVSGTHAANIEALAAAGLTNGCSSTSFCPDRQLTREQLATFMARALQLAPRASGFTDVGAVHDGAVGAIVHAGIARGCTTTRFCARDAADRGWTAGRMDRAVR